MDRRTFIGAFAGAVLATASIALRRAEASFRRGIADLAKLRRHPRTTDVLVPHERWIDAERRVFAREIVAAIQRATAGREQFDVMAYALSRREVDRVFDIWYGRYPGDVRARFPRLIVEQCRAVRGIAFQRSSTDVERRLKAHPDLMRAITAEAA
jgi:hypothetical protein